MRSASTALGTLLSMFASAIGFSVLAADATLPAAPVAGIVAPNVRVISPLLVTAGQPDRASLLRLKAEGYAAVISLAPGNTPDAVADQAEILKSQGVEFVHIPIPWQKPEAKHLDAMAAAMQRLKGKKVLVHCQMNMRASAVTFLYRTIYEKADPAQAWGDVKALWTPTEQWAGFIDAQLGIHGIAFQAR
jgi:protein tyrosine phosphatase (PTP) superfamily phosphohydrolase (DUF442 family)